MKIKIAGSTVMILVFLQVRSHEFHRDVSPFSSESPLLMDIEPFGGRRDTKLSDASIDMFLACL